MGSQRWYGNEWIQRLLEGPFYGFGLDTPGRATEVDFGLRQRGQFVIRYFGKYIICSGPQIIKALGEVLSPEENEVKIYEGQDISDCVAAVFHGEGLKLSPGYVEEREPEWFLKGRASDGEDEGTGGADNAPDEAAEPRP